MGHLERIFRMSISVGEERRREEGDWVVPFGDILAGILSWRVARREGGVCIFGYLQRRLPSAGEGRA